LADLMCVVALVGVAIGLPISLAQVIDVKQREKVLPFGSQRKTQDGSPAVDDVAVVIRQGQIVFSGWRLAIRKLTPIPHLVVLGAVGAFARRRAKSRASELVSLDVSLRDGAAVSPAGSPAAAPPGRDASGETVRWCFACLDTVAQLTIGVTLLILSLIWLGPVPTLGVCLASWLALRIRAFVHFRQRRGPSPGSASGGPTEGSGVASGIDSRNES